MGKIKALYPRIRWGLESQSQNEAAQATMDRKGCDGVVATYNQYQAWRTDVGFCKLEIAQVMAPARGHWLTNRKSPCVAAALNYAISEMDIRGDLELQIAKYFPKISCGDTSAGGGEMDDNWEEAEDEEGRRRSRPPALEEGCYRGDEAQAPSQRCWRLGRRRRRRAKDGNPRLSWDVHHLADRDSLDASLDMYAAIAAIAPPLHGL